MEDRAAIQQAAYDYIEGWYYGDAARMARALHDRLVKRRITPEGEVWQVDKDWMVAATGDGRGKIEHPEQGRKDVTILYLGERMASVKVISKVFVDHLHLIKEAGAWRIVNVLWDYVENDAA
ncbi:MAG: nuclear transport factor 2 family protein [Anaerolineales bacterium]|nr:nuclear transport factor 2 family protein [Anaerolineales bacterium]